MFGGNETMTMIRVLAGAAAVALLATAVSAAEPMNLVGTWKSTGDHAAVIYGDDNDHTPEATTPMFREPSNAWTIVIKEQKGRAFHGVSVSPRGDEETIVGVINSKGDRMLMAGDEAGLTGEILGETIEFCYQDHEDDRAAVACFVAAKE